MVMFLLWLMTATIPVQMGIYPNKQSCMDMAEQLKPMVETVYEKAVIVCMPSVVVPVGPQVAPKPSGGHGFSKDPTMLQHGLREVTW